MSVEIRKATNEDAEQWNRAVERSDQASPFHYYEALKLIEEYSGLKLHPLIGLKGQEPVGVLPVFERTMGPLTLALSPPDGLEIFYLGVALVDPPELKQRKVERQNRRFIEGAVEWLDRTLDPDLTHIRTVDGYTDVRPLKDQDFDVTPYYTYVVDLDRDEEDVLMDFSSDARSNVRDAEDTDVAYEITTGGADACERIIARVNDRLGDLDAQYELCPAFAHDLYERLPDMEWSGHTNATSKAKRSGASSSSNSATPSTGGRVERSTEASSPSTTSSTGISCGTRWTVA